MLELPPSQARVLWRALMDNASLLVQDAYLLLSAGSRGRAMSLTVLAQEELGKALWIYNQFEKAWSEGDEAPRSVAKLDKQGRSHVLKYMEAVVFGDELAEFWGDYGDQRFPGESWEDLWARRKAEAKDAASVANHSKQRGFYVDRDDSGVVHSPSELDAEGVDEALQLAAQVIEMLLIKDHSRMKLEAVTPYDSTHEMQYRLLPISHPEDWAAASEGFKRRRRPEIVEPEAAADRRDMTDPNEGRPPEDADR